MAEFFTGKNWIVALQVPKLMRNTKEFISLLNVEYCLKQEMSGISTESLSTRLTISRSLLELTKKIHSVVDPNQLAVQGPLCIASSRC